MTGEEKIIENFKEFIKFKEDENDYLYQNEEFYKDDIEQNELLLKILHAVLNLIQRLQEEKENLQEENIIYRKQLNNAFDRGFIHKDKIIQEMKNARKRINPYEIYKQESRYYWIELGAISLCERLLKENEVE